MRWTVYNRTTNISQWLLPMVIERRNIKENIYRRRRQRRGKSEQIRKQNKTKMFVYVTQRLKIVVNARVSHSLSLFLYLSLLQHIAAIPCNMLCSCSIMRSRIEINSGAAYLRDMLQFAYNWETTENGGIPMGPEIELLVYTLHSVAVVCCLLDNCRARVANRTGTAVLCE